MRGCRKTAIYYRLMLFALACFIFMPVSVLRAAEITHEKLSDGLGFISIEGGISSGDLEKFRQISIRYNKAIVVLSSEGGALLPAIEIGKIIKIAGYATWVPKDAVCASSCALIWVAGSTRWLSPEGHIGFHASYRDNNGTLEESGVANALIGNYLTLLNLPEKAIIFATRAAPDKVMWLTKANKTSAGIEFEDDFHPDAGEAKAQTPTSQVVRPPVIVPVPLPMQAPTLPSYLPGNLSQTGERWIKYAGNAYYAAYYDANSIRRIVDDKGNDLGRSAWILVDVNNDPKEKIKFSISKSRIYCSNKRIYFSDWVHSYKTGKIKNEYSNKSLSIYGRSNEDREVYPGSYEKVMLRYFCN